MASTTSLFFNLLAISLLLPFTTAIPSTTIISAAEILSNAGYNSMSLTLPLISTTLSLSTLPSATLFSPPDTAFFLSSSGQPSLSLIQFHFCPRLYSLADLLSLPFGSHLPTLLPNSSLTVTSSVFDNFIALNGVNIDSYDPPIFDDGYLTIYGVQTFLDPSYQPNNSVSQLAPSPSHTQDCHLGAPSSGSYWEASDALRTRGYTQMSAFLDLQVNQFKGNDVITVFAPKDDVMKPFIDDNGDWGSLFLRHVIDCTLSWGDLTALNDGSELGTFLKGFTVKIAKSTDGNLMFNGNVTVDLPDIYRSDRILVHGLSGIFVIPTEGNKSGDDQVNRGTAYAPSNDRNTVSDHGEF